MATERTNKRRWGRPKTPSSSSSSASSTTSDSSGSAYSPEKVSFLTSNFSQINSGIATHRNEIVLSSSSSTTDTDNDEKDMTPLIPQHKLPTHFSGERKSRTFSFRTDQTYIKEVLHRAKVEFTEQFKDGHCTYLSGVVCHICHKRKQHLVKFPCGNKAHNYCEYHCATRLGFHATDAKTKPKIVDHCPICCLQCICSKCSRHLDAVSVKFREACQDQSKDVTMIAQTDMEVLPLCRAKNLAKMEEEASAGVAGLISSSKPDGHSHPCKNGGETPSLSSTLPDDNNIENNEKKDGTCDDPVDLLGSSDDDNSSINNSNDSDDSDDEIIVLSSPNEVSAQTSKQKEVAKAELCTPSTVNVSTPPLSTITTKKKKQSSMINFLSPSPSNKASSKVQSSLDSFLRPSPTKREFSSSSPQSNASSTSEDDNDTENKGTRSIDDVVQPEQLFTNGSCGRPHDDKHSSDDERYRSQTRSTNKLTQAEPQGGHQDGNKEEIQQQKGLQKKSLPQILNNIIHRTSRKLYNEKVIPTTDMSKLLRYIEKVKKGGLREMDGDVGESYAALRTFFILKMSLDEMGVDDVKKQMKKLKSCKGGNNKIMSRVVSGDDFNSVWDAVVEVDEEKEKEATTHIPFMDFITTNIPFYDCIKLPTIDTLSPTQNREIEEEEEEENKNKRTKKQKPTQMAIDISESSNGKKNTIIRSPSSSLSSASTFPPPLPPLIPIARPEKGKKNTHKNIQTKDLTSSSGRKRKGKIKHCHESQPSTVMTKPDPLEVDASEYSSSDSQSYCSSADEYIFGEYRVFEPSQCSARVRKIPIRTKKEKTSIFHSKKKTLDMNNFWSSAKILKKSKLSDTCPSLLKVSEEIRINSDLENKACNEKQKDVTNHDSSVSMNSVRIEDVNYLKPDDISFGDFCAEDNKQASNRNDDDCEESRDSSSFGSSKEEVVLVGSIATNKNTMDQQNHLIGSEIEIHNRIYEGERENQRSDDFHLEGRDNVTNRQEEKTRSETSFSTVAGGHQQRSLPGLSTEGVCQKSNPDNEEDTFDSFSNEPVSKTVPGNEENDCSQGKVASAYHIDDFASNLLREAKLVSLELKWDASFQDRTGITRPSVKIVGDFWYCYMSHLKIVTTHLENNILSKKSMFDGTNASQSLGIIAKLIMSLDVGSEALMNYVPTPKGEEVSSSVSPGDIWKLFMGHWNGKELDEFGIIRQIGLIVTHEQDLLKKNIDPDGARDSLETILGKQFGLHLLYTLCQNIYNEARAKMENQHPHEDFPLSNKRMSVARVGPWKLYISIFKNNFSLEQCVCSDSCTFYECDYCGRCYHKKCLSAEEAKSLDDNNNVHWLCPVCKIDKELLHAVRSNNLRDLYDFLVIKGASPLASVPAAPDSGEYCGYTISTPLHISVMQNNYEVTSMLLYGAFSLLDDVASNTVLDRRIPTRCWGRDRSSLKYTGGKNPFDRSLELSKKSMNQVAPIETLILLCNRGCGEVEEVCKIPQHRHSIALLDVSINALVNFKKSPHMLPQDDISFGSEQFKIPWVNDTGDGAVLSNFTYVKRPIETQAAGISWFQCRHKPHTNSKLLVSWADLMKERRCTQEGHGRLEQKQGAPSMWICECNYLSPCSEKKVWNPKHFFRLDVECCGNRFSSSGVQFQFEIFRTSDGRGWGIRTRKNEQIQKGSILFPYAGLILPDSDSIHSPYVLNLGTARTRGKFSVDGKEFRNVACFMNHTCCEPNVEAFKTLANHLDLRFPSVVFKAKTNIPPLTELCWNYGQKLQNCACSFCVRSARGDK